MCEFQERDWKKLQQKEKTYILFYNIILWNQTKSSGRTVKPNMYWAHARPLALHLAWLVFLSIWALHTLCDGASIRAQSLRKTPSMKQTLVFLEPAELRAGDRSSLADVSVCSAEAALLTAAHSFMIYEPLPRTTSPVQWRPNDLLCVMWFFYWLLTEPCRIWGQYEVMQYRWTLNTCG